MNAIKNHDHLVEQYSNFVVKIAKQVKRTLPNSIETEDLISYGMTGLIEAAKRFDSSKGVNFSTFSYYRIRGAIYDGLRVMGSLSRSEYKRQQINERANAYLENDYLSHSNKYIKTSPEDELNGLTKKVQTITTIYLTSMDNQEIQSIKDNHSEALDEKLAKLELCQKIRDAINILPKCDQDLIKSYYFEDLSLEDVGKRLGLSKSWTCRKHAKAIEKLSDAFFTLIKENHSDKKSNKSSISVEKRL